MYLAEDCIPSSNRNRIYTLGSYFAKDTPEFEDTPELLGKDTSESEPTPESLGKDTSESEHTPELSGKNTSESEPTPELSEKNTSGSEHTPKLENEKMFIVLQEKIKKETIKPDEIIMFIKIACKTKEKTAYELGKELSLTPIYLRRKYLQKLVENGDLSVTRGARALHLYQTI